MDHAHHSPDQGSVGWLLANTNDGCRGKVDHESTCIALDTPDTRAGTWGWSPENAWPLFAGNSA